MSSCTGQSAGDVTVSTTAVETEADQTDQAAPVGQSDQSDQSSQSESGDESDETDQASQTTDQSESSTGELEELSVKVVATYPHDVEAFTQGLELDDDGTLLESTGLFGSSDLRRVNLETGEVQELVETPSGLFAEGATKAGDEIIQLTWRGNTAFYWDAATFELNKQVNYEGEGWGLCFDGERLVMTDGSAELIFRDLATFQEIGRVGVSSQGQPVDALNEVECVDGTVWANRWTSDQIVGIDPATGKVTATVDASTIDYQSDNADAVLNGIAWDETTGTFLLTGKLWPTIYRVNFVPTTSE